MSKKLDPNYLYALVPNTKIEKENEKLDISDYKLYNASSAKGKCTRLSRSYLKDYYILVKIPKHVEICEYIDIDTLEKLEIDKNNKKIEQNKGILDEFK